MGSLDGPGELGDRHGSLGVQPEQFHHPARLEPGYPRLLAVAGAADTFTVVFRGTMVQEVTPDEFRGRVMAADYVVGAGGGQLGSLEAGALGSLTSPVVSALSGGLVTVAGSIVIGLALPAFTRYRPVTVQATPARPAAASHAAASPDGE
jgi:hypothetical protein